MSATDFMWLVPIVPVFVAAWAGASSYFIVPRVTPWLRRRHATKRAEAIGVALASIFAPLIIPWSIARGVLWLAAGVAELARALWPRKTAMPQAKVVRR
jgi:hypothetical protein